VAPGAMGSGPGYSHTPDVQRGGRHAMSAGSKGTHGHMVLCPLHPARRRASQAAVMAGSFSKKAVHSAPYWLATTRWQPPRQIPLR
jgi:hypothetical protein